MKNKLLLLVFSLIVFSCSALADTGSHGMMEGYGMMGIGWAGMGLLWLVYLAIGSFIFSLIFWYTYKLVVPQERKKRR